MTPKSILYIGILTPLLSACAEQGDLLPDEDTSQALRITTRAGEDVYLDEGTTVYLSDNNGKRYVEYYIENGEGSLVPRVASDYISWNGRTETSKTLMASSPTADATGFTLPKDQSTDLPDYMTFAGTTERKGDGVTFVLKHRLAQVTLVIGSVDSKYEGCTFDITLFSPYDGISLTYDADGTAVVVGRGGRTEVTPNQATGMSLGSECRALLTPGEADDYARFIRVQPRKDGADYGDALYSFGTPQLTSGNHYRFNFAVDDDEVYINSVTLRDWESEALVGSDEGGKGEDVWYEIDLDRIETSQIYSLEQTAINRGFRCFRFVGTMPSEWNTKSLWGGNIPISGAKKIDMSGVEGMTSISQLAFHQAKGLTEVIAPVGVTSVDWGAFSQCYSIEHISLSEGVTELGIDAFSYCPALTTVDLPSSLTTIYKNAFLYCPGLKSIEAENVQTVGKRAFEHCSSLHTLNLPQLREAGYNLVTDCANLHLLILPRVTNLNTGALDNIPRPEQVDLVFNAKMQSWLEARGISFKSVTYVAPETGLVTESNKEGVVADKPYTEQITIPYTE
jgi:hypothetical protein